MFKTEAVSFSLRPGTKGITQLTLNHLVKPSGKILFVLLLLFVGGSSAHGGMFIVLSLWALRGPVFAIEALTLSWLLLSLNTGIYEHSAHETSLRWLVIMASQLSVLFHMLNGNKKIPELMWLLIVFFVFSCIEAICVSYFPLISVCKLISFFFGVGGVILNYHYSQPHIIYLKAWFLSLFLTILTVSGCLIFSANGYFINGISFQGVLSQPQAYGLFLAPLLLWVISLYLSKQIVSYWLVFGIILGLIELILTNSRTAVFSIVLGSLALLVNKKTMRSSITLLILFASVLFFFTMMFSTFNQNIISNKIQSFYYKDSDVAHGDVLESRQILFEKSISNALTHPLLGIGFGIPSDLEIFAEDTKSFMGLAVGASIEKGNGFLSLLEEEGILGSIVFGLFFLKILWTVLIKKKNITAKVLCLGCVLLNLGEGVLFSVGGFGLLNWVLLIFSYQLSFDNELYQ